MNESPDNVKYLSSHEWIKLEEDGTATVGISDHAQDLLGDIVFVELPEVGQKIDAKQEAAVVESVKAASDVYSPISGEVIEINKKLIDEPEVINSSPYQDGWFYRMKIDDLNSFDKLLSPEEYLKSQDN